MSTSFNDAHQLLVGEQKGPVTFLPKAPAEKLFISDYRADNGKSFFEYISENGSWNKADRPEQTTSPPGSRLKR
jgi:hypothetical protein